MKWEGLITRLVTDTMFMYILFVDPDLEELRYSLKKARKHKKGAFILRKRIDTSLLTCIRVCRKFHTESINFFVVFFSYKQQNRI